jgi:hypothetical protein
LARNGCAKGSLHDGIRRVKDLISRDIIRADEAKIGIASGTYPIVHIPPVEIASLPSERVAMIRVHLRAGDFLFERSNLRRLRQA